MACIYHDIGKRDLIICSRKTLGTKHKNKLIEFSVAVFSSSFSIKSLIIFQTHLIFHICAQTNALQCLP